MKDPYHDDHAFISHSMMEIFRRSRSLYAGRFVTHTIPAPDPTPEMKFGIYLHHALLQPETVAEHFVVPPKCDKRTKEGKAIHQAFVDSLPEGDSYQFVSEEDQARAAAMISSVKASGFSWIIESLGDVETPIYWANGLKKAKPDKLCLGANVVIDLKTAADPSPEAFARSVWNYGYHRQVAHYLDGLMDIYGRDFQFYFLVVGKELPYDVALYDLTMEAINQGRQENEDILVGIKNCHQDGDWTNTWAKDVVTLDLPRYAKNKEFTYV